MNKSEIIKFEQLSINLNNLTTSVIRQPKLQETSTFILLKCLIKNNKSKLCNEGKKRNYTYSNKKINSADVYTGILFNVFFFIIFKNGI